MKPFAYTRPADAVDAVAQASSNPAARYLGGGTNLVDLMKLGVEEPDLLIDVTDLGLEAVEETDAGGLRIGALARNSDIAVDRVVRERFPALSQALLSGASGQLRNVATAAGNVLQRTRCAYFTDVSKPCNKRRPGSGCPARDGEHGNLAILGASERCIATNPSDFAVALAAYDARVEVQTADGVRDVALAEFYLPVGETPHREVALEHGELVTAILVPAPPATARSQYRKVRERASYAFAIASVAAVVVVADDTIRDVRIALGAVSSMPWRAHLTESALQGVAPSADSFAAAADIELAQARPLRDNAYKVPLVRDLVVDTLSDLDGGPRMTVVDKADQQVGTSTTRIEALDKVAGAARYAGEYPFAELAHGVVVTSTIGRGRITTVGEDRILSMPGVLAVLHHGNAPRLHDPGDATLLLLQTDTVPHHGAVVALVVASTLEQAQAAAESLVVRYDEEPHDVGFTADHAKMYVPDQVNPGFDTETVIGDVDATAAAADVVVEATYTTPTQQNNAMEPHATTATWHDGDLTVHDSNQGAASVKRSLMTLFGLHPTQVRVLSEHVGGGFGSKGSARAPVVLASMAALTTGRPVRVTLTRRQMFSLVGYRTPTIQQVRLAADRDGTIIAIDHLAYGQTSTVLEFAEQTAVISRMMYATEALRSRHRLVALDVPTPRWMRAPGEAPGSFALESAVDELAEACGVDPVELRIRNDPAAEPESGLPFSSRNLVACLREGARRFGWHDRDKRPGIRSDGRWLLGTGVAAATYPARTVPSTAAATAEPDGRFTVRITASDIGTGARTALTLVAADALGVAPGQVTVLIGDSDFGQAMIAGGSMGMSSWTWAVADACQELLVEVARREIPADGITVTADTAAKVKAMSRLSRHAFGAQFAEVAVDVRTGEVRVRRMLGIFAAGRIVNPLTARSQLVGGMTMGLSAALLEEAVVDAASGDYVNHDLAGYHVATHADVPDIEVGWVDEVDHEVNPAGIKGIGELGIVGAPAAIANAVWHATGVRQRDLPIRPDRVINAGAVQP